MAVKDFSLLDSNGVRAGSVTGGANTAATNSSCTAASPIVIATAAAHGFLVGDLVKIISSGISGLDGVWKVTAVADTTHFAVAFNNGSGGTTITGKTVSMMAYSTSSAVTGAASTQDGAQVVKTFNNLGNWDQLSIELMGSAVNTASLTFDWVLQRPLDPDKTKWEDCFYVSQGNNTALDTMVRFPIEIVHDNTVQVVCGYTYKDTSLSANGASVTPALTTLKGNAGFWGGALRLVIVPRAANLDGTHLLQVQVIISGMSTGGA